MRETCNYPDIFTRNDYKIYPEAEAEQLIDALIDAMTPEEKMGFVGGSLEPSNKGKIGNAGYQWGVPRLGIPESVLYDGPAGVTGIVETTGLPQPVVLGSTWDTEMAYEFGRIAAAENAACSGNYQLSPQVDTIHSPHFGRNKDMKSEDSYLVSKLSVAETRATQDQNVIATVKHFAVANTFGVFGPGNMPNTVVDEQTLHETYLRPFEETVKYGGTGSMMNSYNRVNGRYATKNSYLNIDILRDQWGYKGSLMADWGSVHDFTLNTGMDLEMPYSAYNNNDRIIKHLVKGDLTYAQLNLAVRHLLYGMNTVGLLGLVQVDETGRIKEEPHRTKPIQMEWRYEEEVARGMLEDGDAVAQKILEEGIILLKNQDQTLPLKEEEKLAVIGLGAKYPICGQQQERSYGRIRRMVSGAEALSEELGRTITPYPAIDYLGETIPANVLYIDEACTKHGVLRFAGIEPEDKALKVSSKKLNGAGAAFTGFGDSVDEDGERVYAWLAPASRAVKTTNVGELLKIDEQIRFVTNSKDYKNAEDGNAFPEGCGSYTWKGFLKAPEDGTYHLKLLGIGGDATFLLNIDGEWRVVADIRTRECTQWPWDAALCSDTGMTLIGDTGTLEKDKVYPFIVFAEHSVINKDLQLEMAWATPSFGKKNYEAALQAAAEADKIVLYAVNSEEDEQQMQIIMKSIGRDIEINPEQGKLIQDVIAAKKPEAKLIVIVQTSNAIATGAWAEHADAIVTGYHTGQEGSRVIAKILTGKINPSGKLSQTWPKTSEGTPLSDTQEHYIERYYGREISPNNYEIKASEGIFFGYRWNDKYNVEPQFAFGHGLSYTTYEYSNLTVQAQGATYVAGLDVTNTGEIAGDEVVQVYLGEASEVPVYIQMAKKQLAGFTRVRNIAPGETRHVEIELDERAFSYWDPAKDLIVRADGTKDKWTRALGRREILIGASSRDIRLVQEIVVE